MSDCKLKINNTNTLMKAENSTGSKKTEFEVVTGNRLLFTLFVTSLDVGADISIYARHRFSGETDYIEHISHVNRTADGPFTFVVAEFHSQMEVEVVVANGNATYYLGVSIFDDSGTTIRGRDGRFQADVIFEDGIYKLATDKKVQVESLAGIQQTASNYFLFEEVSVGDTLRIEITATDLTPIYDETFTVLAGEDRYDFATRIALEQNQDFGFFNLYFKTTRVHDNSILYMESKITAEAGENATPDSFQVSGTGTIVATLQRNWDDWIRRSSTIQASKSTDDPRVGIFGVEGTVETRTADVSGLYIQQPYRNADPLDVEMAINPGGGSQVFTFPADALHDIFISELRFFGLDNGIQFEKFLGNNTALTNGIKVEIKSDNNIIMLPLIKTTEDFADKFAFGGGNNFSLYIQAGGDKFLASFLSAPFPLRRAGTFGVGLDDYIKITISDNLSQVSTLQSIVEGVIREV